jgi:hypothetical protein
VHSELGGEVRLERDGVRYRLRPRESEGTREQDGHVEPIRIDPAPFGEGSCIFLHERFLRDTVGVPLAP